MDLEQTSEKDTSEASAIHVFQLPDGRSMEVRPTTLADADRICELYRSLDLVDRHRRFFSAFQPHEEWCRKWSTVAERGGCGLIAVVHGGGGPDVVAGEAGYAMRPDGDGDLGITVAAPWRGWLGPYLLDVLVGEAARRGVRNLQAEVLVENSPMLSLLRYRDAVTRGHEGGVIQLSVGTSGTTPTWPPADTRPRVLVEVAGGRWTGERAAESEGLSAVMCTGPTGRQRHACPVLEGGRCPLADAADAIVVLLDPSDERTQQLVEAHHRSSPGRPILVGHSFHAGDAPTPCVEIDSDGSRAVSQILSLIGQRPTAAPDQG